MINNSTNDTESIETTTVEDSMTTESIESGQTKSIESNELESTKSNKSHQEESIDELESTESSVSYASNKSTESTEELEDNKGDGLDVESTSSDLNKSFDQDIFNDSMVESETSDITSSLNGDSRVFFDSACEKQKSQMLPPMCLNVSIKMLFNFFFGLLVLCIACNCRWEKHPSSTVIHVSRTFAFMDRCPQRLI